MCSNVSNDSPQSTGSFPSARRKVEADVSGFCYFWAHFIYQHCGVRCGTVLEDWYQPMDLFPNLYEVFHTIVLHDEWASDRVGIQISRRPGYPTWPHWSDSSQFFPFCSILTMPSTCKAVQTFLSDCERVVYFTWWFLWITSSSMMICMLLLKLNLYVLRTMLPPIPQLFDPWTDVMPLESRCYFTSCLRVVLSSEKSYVWLQ